MLCTEARLVSETVPQHYTCKICDLAPHTHLCPFVHALLLPEGHPLLAVCPPRPLRPLGLLLLSALVLHAAWSRCGRPGLSPPAVSGPPPGCAALSTRSLSTQRGVRTMGGAVSGKQAGWQAALVTAFVCGCCCCCWLTGGWAHGCTLGAGRLTQGPPQLAFLPSDVVIYNDEAIGSRRAGGL